MYKGIFLDDRQNQSNLTQFLAIDGLLEMQFKCVDSQLEDMAGAILDQRIDILALDYRLDDTPEGSVRIRYKAGPLAQQLRDHAMEMLQDDFPIVVVSGDDVLRDLYQPDRTNHDLFDRIYRKETLDKDSRWITSELLALVEGYKTIIQEMGNGLSLPRLFDVDQDQDEEGCQLLERQELRAYYDLKVPHQLAREILRNLITRNGLLLDELALRAWLGVAADSPDLAGLQEHLERAGTRFAGVFHSGWQRWWEYRIAAFGRSHCGEELGNLTAAERVIALNRSLGLKLQPATSRWTNSPDFYPGFACASCGHPADIGHSVAAFDPVSAYVARKRICWDCVATGAYENVSPRLEPDEGEAYVVEKLRNGDICK